MCTVLVAQTDSIPKPQKPIDYQSTVSKADLAFSAKDYLIAKHFYTQALSAKPDEAYPKTQIDACDKKMSSDSWMSTELDCPCHKGKVTKPASNNVNPVMEVTAIDTMVYSVFPGKVSSVNIDSGGHSILLIKHGKYLATYSNLSGVLVSPGDEVKEGAQVGYYLKRDHPYLLRFSIWNGKAKEDPKKYLKCKSQ